MYPLVTCCVCLMPLLTLGFFSVFFIYALPFHSVGFGVYVGGNRRGPLYVHYLFVYLVSGGRLLILLSETLKRQIFLPLFPRHFCGFFWLCVFHTCGHSLMCLSRTFSFLSSCLVIFFFFFSFPSVGWLSCVCLFLTHYTRVLCGRFHAFWFVGLLFFAAFLFSLSLLIYAMTFLSCGQIVLEGSGGLSVHFVLGLLLCFSGVSHSCILVVLQPSSGPLLIILLCLVRAAFCFSLTDFTVSFVFNCTIVV